MSHPMNIPMHRFKYTRLSKSQIGEKLKAVTESGPVCRSEYSGELSGKSIKIITDNGPVFEYSFRDKKRLSVNVDGKPFTGSYGALTLKNMIFFSHIIPLEQRGYNVFIDQDTSLVTIIEVWFSSSRKERTMGGNGIIIDDREVQRQIYYGYIQKNGQAAPETRHHLTNRIEGKGMYWVQDTGIETLEFYSSVVSTNFVELTRLMDELGYCSPSDYLLVNDNIFIYNRTECEFSGIFTSYAVDLSTLKQVGLRLGFNERDELEYYMFRGEGKIVGDLTPLGPFEKQGNEPLFPQTADRPISPVKGQRMAYRPRYLRHELSDDLVGHAWSWTYSNNMTSMHLFTAPNSHSWTIYTSDQSLGAQWCAPSLLVKVRNGVHILAESEEACNGSEMVVMILAIFPYAMQAGSPMVSDSVLVRMARLHGGGINKWHEKGICELYLSRKRKEDSWMIKRLNYRTESISVPVSPFKKVFPDDPSGPDKLV